MPLVNIKLIEDPISPQQKSELIAGVTEVLARVLGKNPAATWVIIDEIAADNWGVGGESIAQRRQQAS